MSKHKKKQEKATVNEVHINMEKVKITRITRGDTIEEVIEIERPINKNEKEETKYTILGLKTLTEIILKLLTGSCVLFAILFIIASGKTMFEFNFSKESIITFFIYLSYSVFLGVMSIPFIKMRKELDKIKNENLIMSLFSAMVALVALIISAISLFKR